MALVRDSQKPPQWGLGASLLFLIMGLAGTLPVLAMGSLLYPQRAQRSGGGRWCDSRPKASRIQSHAETKVLSAPAGRKQPSRRTLMPGTEG